MSLANKTRNSMSLANKRAKYFRKDTNYDTSQNNTKARRLILHPKR